MLALRSTGTNSTKHTACDRRGGENKTRQQQQQTTRRRREDLKCGVCGLPAKSYHFGGVSCDSCKVFFRRVIRNESYRYFLCHFDGHCVVVPPVKKMCSSCRFAKCLRIGMDPRWVLTVEQRQMLRLSKLQKLGHSHSTIDRMYDPDPKELWELFTEAEMTTVRTMVVHYKDIVSKVPFKAVVQDIYREAGTSALDSALTALDITYHYRMIRFAYALPEFASLRRENRDILLKSHLVETGMVRSIYEYDIQNECWPNDKAYDKYPKIQVDQYAGRLSSTFMQLCDVYCEHQEKLRLDEPSTLLLMFILLLSTDGCEGLTEKDKIEALQERFLSILRKYVQWRYGAVNVGVVYAKLLSLLTEAQDTNIVSSEKHSWVDNGTLEYLERRLGKLNYLSHYSVEKRDQVFVPATVDPYDVLDDSVPTIDMLRRGAMSLCHVVSGNNPSSPTDENETSRDSCDLFTLIEELDNAPITQQRSSSQCAIFDLDKIFGTEQPSSPWSPEEFDLSWC